MSLRAEDMIAARLWLMYDAGALELVSVENGDCLAGMTCSDDLTASLYCMLWADSLRESPCASDGALAVLAFRVKDDATPGEAAVTLFASPGDAFSAGLEVVSPVSAQGAVVVTAPQANVLRLPQDAVSIGEEAFAGCDFDTVYLTGDSLRTIGSRAFAGCGSLRSVFISPGVTDIAPDAFEGCHDLVLYCGEGSAALAAYAQAHGFGYQE